MEKIKKDLIKIGENLLKNWENVHKNFVKSLDKISYRNNTSKEDYWYPTFGPEAKKLPENFQVVLIRIRSTVDQKDMEEPRIARFERGGIWRSQETGLIYNTPMVPFEVRYWRPII